MSDNEIVRVKVAGDFACFTRPDLKVERMTYPCMTPSAARGVLDSILWKPEFQWWVHRIIVLNSVKFFSVKRNEINAKQGKTPIIIEEKESTTKSSIFLKDVAYTLSKHRFIKRNLTQRILSKKYAEMFKRRVKKGQCWRRPFLGTREFAAEFFMPDGTEQPIQEIIPIGSMLFDIFFDAKGKPSPLFFYDVAVLNGILECPKTENEKMMLSSHFQPEMDSEASSIIYGFNQNEEKEVVL